MFKQLFPVLLFPLLLIGAGCAQTAEVDETAMQNDETAMEEEMAQFVDGSYMLNLENSSIEWEGAKAVGSAHYGSVSASEGALMVQDGMIVGGTIVVDMTTISTEDLEGGAKQSLDDHLKNDDFFSVETYPTATFAFSEAVALEGIEDATHRIAGEMTVKGLGNEMTFPAMISMEDGAIMVVADLEVDRTVHDVQFGSGKFFEDLGDNLINDMFTLSVDLAFEMGEDMDDDMQEEADMEKEGEEDEMEEEEDDMDASMK